MASKQSLQVTSPGLVDGPGTHPVSHESVLKAVEAWPRLAYVLADIRRALQDAGGSPFYCYRAIEAISTYWPGSGAVPWKAMQDVLKLDKTFLTEIKKLADKIRHGEFITVTGEARHWLMRSSWITASRFVTLIESNLRELPTTDFPHLVSLPTL
jgi:hypothetical protein